MTSTPPREVLTIPRIQHAEAMVLAARENHRFAEQLEALDTEDWGRRTDCPRWDVRQVAAHVIGSAAAQASMREFIRQLRLGRSLTRELGSSDWWDGMNEVQVRERASATSDNLRAEWATISRRALRARTKLPRLIARLPLLKLPDPLGRQSLAYLFDLGFTRDVWMHRVDIVTAVGQRLQPEPHDRRIVEDLVAEWAGTHGEAFELELTGPAGGSFRSGKDGEHVRIDAIEFARTLAGRESGSGVLRHPLPL